MRTIERDAKILAEKFQKSAQDKQLAAGYLPQGEKDYFTGMLKRADACGLVSWACLVSDRTLKLSPQQSSAVTVKEAFECSRHIYKEAERLVRILKAPHEAARHMPKKLPYSDQARAQTGWRPLYCDLNL
ncbi:MAG: hypothetical protein L6Q57_05220 [Alphaproteobacteria bacterium]|nr:hypothetical protein [Alphaproteobacteria bacterium]